MDLCGNCGHVNRKELVACERCGCLLDDNYRKEQEVERQRLKQILEKMLETY